MQKLGEHEQVSKNLIKGIFGDVSVTFQLLAASMPLAGGCIGHAWHPDGVARIQRAASHLRGQLEGSAPALMSHHDDFKLHMHALQELTLAEAHNIPGMLLSLSRPDSRCRRLYVRAAFEFQI